MRSGFVRLKPSESVGWHSTGSNEGRIIEGGQFEVVWSSEKPIRPEPYPGSRSPAAWNEFLAELRKSWDGHWTKPEN